MRTKLLLVSSTVTIASTLSLIWSFCGTAWIAEQQNRASHCNCFYKKKLTLDTRNYSTNQGFFVWSEGNHSYVVPTTAASLYENHNENLKALAANVIDGYVTPTQANFFRGFLQAHPDITNILETGFNAGHSAAIFLGTRPDIKVTSFDIADHDYVQKGQAAIEQSYPGRLKLIIGNSIHTLPQFINTQNSRNFDCGFVDGGHTGKAPYLDIVNMAKLIKKGGWILVDDVVDCCPDVVTAWYQAIAEGIVTHVSIVSFEDRGWAIGKIN